MISISKQQDLITFLTSYKSAAKANFVSKTELKMNKKDVATKTIKNPHPTTYKVSLFEGEINFDYEDKVNDARFIEGKDQDFKAGAAVNGLQFLSKALSIKDGKHYIKIIPGKKLTSTVYEQEDGTKIDYDELKPYVPVAKPSASGSQELDKPVPFRAFKLDSIIHISIPGVMEYTQE